MLQNLNDSTDLSVITRVRVKPCYKFTYPQSLRHRIDHLDTITFYFLLIWSASDVREHIWLASNVLDQIWLASNVRDQIWLASKISLKTY